MICDNGPIAFTAITLHKCSLHLVPKVHIIFILQLFQSSYLRSRNPFLVIFFIQLRLDQPCSRLFGRFQIITLSNSL